MKFSVDNLKKMIDKDRVGDWVVQHKRQVAVGCIAFCLVVVAGVSLANSGASGTAEGTEPAAAVENDAAQESLQSAAEIVEESNDLEKDAYPAVNELVQKYYDYIAAGDVEGLASVEDQASEEEQNRILRSRDLVEGYQNISCYTKKGLEEGSYLVFVYYELKFYRIDTAAPGMQALYVYPNEEGNLVVFNGETSDELKAYVEQVAQDDDVLALREEVKTKYEEAKAADENLVKQEERYQRIAAESAGQETVEEEVAEAPVEETPSEETPAEEQPAEEEPSEEPTEETGGEAVAQNRETRFTESVRLRSEPSTDGEYLGTAFPGESVTQIESYDTGWSKISYNGTECYCMTEYLE